MTCSFRGRRLCKAIALLWICFMVSASAVAQRFTTPKENSTLKEIFDRIQTQTYYRWYNTGSQELLEQVVHTRFRNYPVKKFLEKYLWPLGVNYTLDKYNDSLIVLSEREDRLQPGDSPQQILPHIYGLVRRARSDSGIVFLSGITVQIKGTSIKKQTRPDGYYSFDSVPANAILVFSGVNVITAEAKVIFGQSINVALKDKVTNLERVFVNNGFEQRPKDSITGAYDIITPAMINRSPSSNALNRIEYQSPGVSVTHNSKTTGTVSPENIIIRGFSSINAGNRPLIIMDNLIYTGDIQNINPEDIESFTVLKDADAMSVWGAMAANGTIVITTKKGKTPKPTITVTNTFSFQGPPDVYNYKPIPSADLIDAEKLAYQNNFYDRYLNSGLNFAPLSPVITLLNNAHNGLISEQAADAAIASLRNNDVRRDIKNSFYRSSPEQQYTIQVAGKTPRMNYFTSLGLTHLMGGLTGMKQQRHTGRGQLTYALNKQLLLSATISYADYYRFNIDDPGTGYRSFHGGKQLPTYFPFKDDQGNPTSFYGDNNAAYMQQMVPLGFQNAVWSPLLDPGRESNKKNTRDYLANLGLHYTLSPGWFLDIRYQYQRQKVEDNDFHAGNSYFVKDIINQFMQPDPATGLYFSPVPAGGISDHSRQIIASQQARVQLDHKMSWDSARRTLSFMGGAEFRNIVTTGDTGRLYGIDNPHAPPSLNDSILYPPSAVGTGQYATIPVGPGSDRTTDRFLSGYLKGTYTYKGRYTVSGSFREDFANLYGAEANKKWMPLWSIGAKWHLVREDRDSIPFLSRLTLRASTGTLGNTSRLAAAYTTIATMYGGVTGTQYSTAYIRNPPNTDLSWEKSGMSDLGIDFTTERHVLTGTIDVFTKRSSKLLIQTFLDPTLGGIQNPGTRAYYFNNSAAMRVNGVDMTLNIRNLTGPFEWTTTLLFSALSSKVTRFSGPPALGRDYLDPDFPNPVLSRPLFGVYAYKWSYLDKQNGDPMGVWNGQPSKNWATIYNSTTLDSMVYKGPSQPRVFGAVRNSFTYKDLTLSFTISYKLGYVVRMPALSYSDLFNNWNSLATYLQRWQKTGDELHTTVPSVDYTGNASRDAFYANSEIMVVKADNIRIEDIMLSYEPDEFHLKKRRFHHIRIFLGASNLGLIYIGNKYHFDAYSPNMPKYGVRISGGFSISY